MFAPPGGFMFELDDIQAIFDDWGSGYPWKAEYIPMLLALANAYGQQFPQRRDDIVEGIVALQPLAGLVAQRVLEEPVPLVPQDLRLEGEIQPLLSEESER